ncbi:MAG: J domain-containing protein [Cyanobacteriota bacterium]|nr:J domain-containing protein [Cyanobacteriota bacterium]
MKLRFSFITLLQIIPVIVLIISLVNPYSAVPIFGLLLLLFPILLFKFFQQAVDDFDRELYLKNEPKKKEFQGWHRIHIENESNPETEELNRLNPHLYTLRLSFPYTLDRLNQAYRQRARETHPDLPGGSKREFIRVRQAYEILKDELGKA